ncbi:hypothetical protein [Actinomyces faecalis]|uniref:hypothetical protein n=1 Tax=Actinomyces faecalis TaxID=2722820 RepID=UPI00155439D8|nr:hypothetical protein [Actinomyces faecalis]
MLPDLDGLEVMRRIRGYTELIQREGRDIALPASTVHTLQRVHSEAVRMTGLVEAELGTTGSLEDADRSRHARHRAQAAAGPDARGRPATVMVAGRPVSPGGSGRCGQDSRKRSTWAAVACISPRVMPSSLP